MFVVKTVECDEGHCSYCYVSHKNDNSYSSLFHWMSYARLQDTIDFIVQGCKHFHFNNLFIVFSGEPLLQDQSLFTLFCEQLIRATSGQTQIHFSLKTTGLNLSLTWLDLLAQYNVTIHLALTRPPTLCHKHSSISFLEPYLHEKIQLLHAHKVYSQKGFSIDYTIQPGDNPSRLYSLFFDKLSAQVLDLLISAHTHETKYLIKSGVLGDFLAQLFECWINDNEQKEIQLFSSILDKLLHRSATSYHISALPSDLSLPVITINSYGTLFSDESLSALAALNALEKNVKSCSLSTLLKQPNFQLINQALHTLPRACQVCLWKPICQGGELIHRYSIQKNFNNASVYCEDLKMLYRKICVALIERGWSMNEIINQLKK